MKHRWRKKKRPTIREPIEVYPKRDLIKTLNRLPDLSVPDRNSHLIIRGSTELRHSCISTEKPKYDGKMLEREQKAQEEIKRKKKQVAILYNKGGYQFPCGADDPKKFGRK